MAVVVAFGLAAALAPARAVAEIQGCPGATPTYFDACGPTFTLPAWGDAGGWTDPSKYSTIQLADVNGDGKDELIARNDQGIEIYWFDTSVGQWRPQVDANDVQVVLTDFASPAPGTTPATDWTKPQYYSTIQAANVDGQPGAEILGRFADGVHVYKYVPPAGTNSIDGGSWQRLGGSAGFSDAAGGADPDIYLTIHTGVVHGGSVYIFGRRHATPDDDSGLALAVLQNGNWVLSTAKNPGPIDSAVPWNDTYCAQPACYLNVQGAAIASTVPDQPGGYATNLQGVGEVLSRTPAGVGAWTFGSFNRWFAIGGYNNHPFTSTGPGFDINTPGPFTDVAGAPDCPFSSNGASGPGSGDCLGTSASYYETLRTANVDGQPGEELLGRASDGLRVKRFNGHGYDSLATLSALGGAASNLVELTNPGLWGSIRTGDVLGNGRDQVLALDGQGLEVYSYDPGSNSWTELQPSMPVTLTGDWLTHPEYYSTIRVGDVDGDGHADVVVRGPFGIRTFFYNRRGTGGWESYLPGGYADFPTRQCPPGVKGPCGQQGAFMELNDLASKTHAINSDNVRNVWTMNTPDTTTLATLQTDLAGSLIGNCGSNQTSFAPPAYSSCVPPSGSTTFTAADWTAVVNEILSEAYFAEEVVDQFNDLKTIRQGVFESESGSLPAIASDLQLAGAAGNTATFNLQGFFAGATGIAASAAGAFEGGAELSAALWVASELISMLPSASDTANSTFQTTYAGLLAKFATAQDEMSDEWSSQLQQVLGDQGLLSLVGQLRSSGTWKLDINGMLSASREAFALQTYQALLPTMYQRYVITNCTTTNTVTCDGMNLPSGPYVTNHSGTSATFLGPPDANPCATYYGPVCDYSEEPGTIPDSVANLVWGPVSSVCNYVPGNPNTVWHYGCSLGVPIATSIRADSPGWTFATASGNPVVNALGGPRGAVRALPGMVRASGAGPSLGGHATAVRTSARAARDVLGPLRFSGRVFLTGELRLSQMRVVIDRILFEHLRREELAQSGPNRRIRPFALRRVRRGLFATRRSGVQARLNLRRLDVRGGARLDLQLTVRTRDIRALCGVLPASVSLEGRPLELETRLRLRDRGLTEPITLRQRWRCMRDRKGEFTGIEPIQPRPMVARPGLSVRMQTPVAQASGRRAIVLITVTNRRRPRSSRVVSSLWNLRITGTAGGAPRTISIKELRAGRSRTIRLTLNLPTTARGAVCVRVAAAADSARTDTARRCAQAARAAPVAGLGAVRTPSGTRGWLRAVTLSFDEIARATGHSRL